MKQTTDKIATLDQELKANKLLTTQVLTKIKSIFLEALAKLMTSPQTQPQKQLSLVLREVEVKTPGHAGTGPKYEHPPKQNIDF